MLIDFVLFIFAVYVRYYLCILYNINLEVNLTCIGQEVGCVVQLWNARYGLTQFISVALVRFLVWIERALLLEFFA